MKSKIINLTSKDELRTVATTLDKDSIMSDGYGIICKSIMTDKNISIQAKAIYAYLSSFAGTDGSCFPTVKRIREDLNIKSSDTYYKHLQQLIDNGYIVIHQTKIDNMKSNNIYEIILSKSKIEKLKEDLKIDKDNKKVASTRNTNNFKEDLAQSSINQYIDSITQNKNDIQEKSNITFTIDQKTHDNIKILKSSGIKYIPYKKQEKFILSMNTEILMSSIEVTVSKAQSPNWNYLLSTYEDLKNKSSIKEKTFTKTKFHNFDETFTQYEDDEFEKMILEIQKKKFG